VSVGVAGYRLGMTEKRVDDERVEERADELWPEEAAAGSDDPQQQAEQILRESDERIEDPEGTAAESVQTSTPDQRP
jgi:hypothetical protein